MKMIVMLCTTCIQLNMCNFMYSVCQNTVTSAKWVLRGLNLDSYVLFFFLFFLLERLVVAAEHCENSLEDLLREGKPVR